MTKEEVLAKLNELGIPSSDYSLGYELKNLATNIHTLPNGKYYVFSLDEIGRKFVIKTDIKTEEEAFDILYKKIKRTHDLSSK